MVEIKDTQFCMENLSGDSDPGFSKIPTTIWIIEGAVIKSRQGS